MVEWNGEWFSWQTSQRSSQASQSNQTSTTIIQPLICTFKNNFQHSSKLANNSINTISIQIFKFYIKNTKRINQFEHLEIFKHVCVVGKKHFKIDLHGKKSGTIQLNVQMESNNNNF